MDTTITVDIIIQAAGETDGKTERLTCTPGFTGQGENAGRTMTARRPPCHALTAHAAIWALYGPDSIPAPSAREAGGQVSAADITRMVETVDRRFEPLVRDYCDYDDLPGIHPVYRIGDWGWIREDQWDTVFAPWPDWAPYAYEIDANALDYEHLRERIAHTINHGGSTALKQWCDDLMDANQFDTVFYTEVGRDC